MHLKVVRKWTAKVLIPGAACVTSSINTSASQAYLSRLISRGWLLFGHHEQTQPFDPPPSLPPPRKKVCRGCISRAVIPMFLCSTRKNQEKLSRLHVGESVRSHHCGILLAALYHKSRHEVRSFARQNPSGANNSELWKTRPQHAQFTLCQWQCCLVLLPFPPFTCHGRKQQPLIFWRLLCKTDFFRCRTSCERN